MRISDWSSDVCSSDLVHDRHLDEIDAGRFQRFEEAARQPHRDAIMRPGLLALARLETQHARFGHRFAVEIGEQGCRRLVVRNIGARIRSEEHTSELQSLMRISYAVFCLKHKKNNITSPSKTSS